MNYFLKLKFRRLLAWSCSFTVHTVAGLIVPEIQEEGKVLQN